MSTQNLIRIETNTNTQKQAESSIEHNKNRTKSDVFQLTQWSKREGYLSPRLQKKLEDYRLQVVMKLDKVTQQGFQRVYMILGELDKRKDDSYIKDKLLRYRLFYLKSCEEMSLMECKLTKSKIAKIIFEFGYKLDDSTLETLKLFLQRINKRIESLS